MATRSYIAIEIADNDINKVITHEKASTASYPKEGCGWSYKKDLNTLTFPQVKLSNKYGAVYHHWDGYPDGLGEELLNNYKTYDEVLNLIAGGAISTAIVDDNESPRYYFTRKGEDWEYIQPTFVDDKNDIPQECFTYLFSNGEWYVKEVGEKSFTPLKEVLS